MCRVRVTEIGEVKSYEYTVSVGIQQAVKAPLFKEFKNRGEMLTREMCFIPALTLTTWLRELYSIQPITVATGSNKELSFFKIDAFYLTSLNSLAAKLALRQCMRIGRL